jgi:hypothetical protein
MKRFGHLLPYILICLTLAVSSRTASPQTAKPDPQPKKQLKLPVWVEAEGGKFWTDGKRQSFKVFIEDKEVPVKGFQGPTNSTVVLVVFDTVVDLARVDVARAALGEAIKGLKENYWVGLMSAQGGLSVLQEPTADRAALGAKIQAVPVSGKAGLLDTLEPVSRLAAGMMQKAGVRVAVLYVTDSGIANYQADYLNPVINASDAGDLSRRFSDRAVQERVSQLSQSLAEFTVPLFVLHLAHRADTLNLAYQGGLERIAADAGGAALFCRTPDEIKPSVESLFERIRAGYVLTVEPPGAKRRSAKLRVEARGADGQPLARVLHAAYINLQKH